MTTVAVIGATGGIGRHVARMAADSGYTVRALARRPEAISRHSRIAPIRFDAEDLASIRSGLAGADVILSCLGNDRFRPPVTADATRRMLEAATDAKRFVVISSVGVGDSADQGRKVSWMFMNLIVPTVLRTVFRDLAHMEQVCSRSETTTVVVRPVGLTNAAGSGRFTAVGSSENVGSMVSREDVARFMVSLVEDDHWDDRAVTIGPG